ncbi:MAG: hypothetical protein DRP30_05835 [Thermotoga sp.]|nr:MAG: hypothetical protein DRP30_05835 [Thermotoga sp.]
MRKGFILVLILVSILFILSSCSSSFFNHAPKILNLIINPTNLKVGQVVNIRIEAEDEDNDALEYETEIFKGNMKVYTSHQNEFNYSPNQAGEYIVVATVRDEKGATDTKEGSFTVVENNPPTMEIILSANLVVVGQSITASISVHDPDEDQLNGEYVVKSPDGATVKDGNFDETGTVVTFLTTLAGTYTIEATVTDGLSEVSERKEVQVIESAIVITNPSSGERFSTEQDVIASADVDENVNMVRFELYRYPDMINVDFLEDHTEPFSWDMGVLDQGDYLLKALAFVNGDGDPIGEDSVVFHVVENHPPTVSLTVPSTHECCDDLVVEWIATDTNLTTGTLLMKYHDISEDVVSSSVVLDSPSGTYSFHPYVGNSTITVVFFDEFGKSASETKTVEVQDTKQPKITLEVEDLEWVTDDSPSILVLVFTGHDVYRRFKVSDCSTFILYRYFEYPGGHLEETSFENDKTFEREDFLNVEGTFGASVVATDSNGFVSRIISFITVDKTSPEAFLSVPSSSCGNFTATYTATDANFRGATITVDDATLIGVPKAENSTITLDIPKTFDNEEVEVELRVIDWAGNESQVTQTIWLDTREPNFQHNIPNTLTSTVVSFLATFTDNGFVKDATIVKYSGVGTLETKYKVSPISKTVEIEGTITVPSTSGVNICLEFTATDSCEHLTDSTQCFEIDTE